jgi:hypothetical protein
MHICETLRSANGLSSHSWRIPAFPVTAALLDCLVGEPEPGAGSGQVRKGGREACWEF